MSTLTKVLIVLMTLCAVIAAVVFIQAANVVPNYRAAYEAERSARLASDTRAAASQTHYNDLAQKVETAKKSMEGQVAAMQTELEGANRQSAQYRQSIAELTNDKVNLQASNAGLTTALQQQTARADQLARLLDERQAVIQSQNAQLQEQDLRLKELSRDLDHTKEAAQKNLELAAAMEARVKELEEIVRRGGMTVAAAEAPRQPTAAEKIEGRVLAVLTEQNVAQLNVGSASGVQPGMEFVLYRGDSLVGKLSVAKVDATTCAGTLSDLQLTPQQGDMATTRLTVR